MIKFSFWVNFPFNMFMNICVMEKLNSSPVSKSDRNRIVCLSLSGLDESVVYSAVTV